MSDCAHFWSWSAKTCTKCAATIESVDASVMYFRPNDAPSVEEWLTFLGNRPSNPILYIDARVDAEAKTVVSMFVGDRVGASIFRGDLPAPPGVLPISYEIGADEVEKGPDAYPTEVRTMDEFYKQFAAEHGFADRRAMDRMIRRTTAPTGTFISVLREVESVLDDVRPQGVPIPVLRRMLAEHWLGRPQGVFARLRWAAKLLFDT